MLEKKLKEDIEDIGHSTKIVGIIGISAAVLFFILAFTYTGGTEYGGLGFLFLSFLTLPATVVIVMILAGVSAQKRKELAVLQQKRSKKPSVSK